MYFLLSAAVKCPLLPSNLQLHQLKSLRCVVTYENATKKGRGESTTQLKSTYQSSEVEANWYNLWESRNYFKPSKSEKDSFVVLLPPPNITGTLHLGHALTCTIQDVILRWKRMKGESVLWVPGIDHAGIATQVAVEKYLSQSSGLSRHDVGKEKFVETIWQWKNEKGAKIIEQLRRMGASVDWSKLIFTLDSSHSHLVNKSFIQLYNEGLIYRKESLVNWSCALKSSISDIEVNWISVEKKTDIQIPGYDKPVGFGYIYEFAYKVCDEDDEIVVSTTRPETMLGDVAVAINPNSVAHSKFKNKFVWHPFRNEKIPVIVDDFVDVNFGTGAVKITPSHSLIDFEIALKHKLNCINVINEVGLITNVGTNEKFHGLKRFDARWAVIKELKNLNLFRGSKPHSMKVPVCSRSGDIIELLLKEQWFLKCSSLMEKAVNAVESGEMEITPETHKKMWYNWLRNETARDWNLSRQLWWGHQVPMYECQYNDKIIWLPGLSLEDAKSKASEEFGAAPGDIKVMQDPDVLDTWFSSGLLSLNSMIDQNRNPPISLMITGHDILFFWVARMVMLSIQLKGQLPFKEVFLHGLVCDSKGKKMSKSIGNVIHPDDVINGLSKSEMESRLQDSVREGRMSAENFKKALASQNSQFPSGIPECGVDALRFTLCSGGIQGFFTNFEIKKCVANKFFCNKIYQGFNYFNKITNTYAEKRREFDLEDTKTVKDKLNCFDLWILSRMAYVIARVDASLSAYRFDRAANEIKCFIVDDFCNFYLNTTKAILEDCSSAQFRTTVSVCFHCLETSLRLLSPFMPFLTEYLYQGMPELNGYTKQESITIAKFPEASVWSEFQDRDLELRFLKISEYLTCLRRTKNLFHLNEEKPNVFTKCPDSIAELLFGEMQYVFKGLGQVDSIVRVENMEKRNIIRLGIDEHFVAFLEHKYDRATVLNFVESTINKENELKRNLENLLKSSNNSEKSAIEKLKLDKQINNLQLDLKKIEELKFAVDNCER